MNTRSIHFRCPHCRSRLKAPAQLIGQSRSCPGCGEQLAVRIVPEDAGAILVPVEERERFRLAVAFRQPAMDLRRWERYPARGTASSRAGLAVATGRESGNSRLIGEEQRCVVSV
jgi:hypothetical protein